MPKDTAPLSQLQDIGSHRIPLTVFPNNLARTKSEYSLTLPALAAMMLATKAERKDRLPLVKLATFGETASAKKCLRTDANMGMISGIEVEHDAGTVSFKAAMKVLREAGLRAIGYTTPSHIPVQRERWRVLLPLSRPLAKGERKRLVALVNGLFGGALARESFVASQAFYFGSVGEATSHVQVLGGEFVDLSGLTEEVYPQAVDKSGTNNLSAPHTAHSLEDLDKMLEMTRQEGHWHLNMLAVTASLVARGWEEKAIREKCADYCRHGADDPDLDEMLASAIGKFGRTGVNLAGVAAALDAAGVAIPVTVTPPNWPGGVYPNTVWPKPNMVNAKAAMEALGIVVRHDVFHDEKLIEAFVNAGADFAGPLTDANMLKMRAALHAVFGTDFKKLPTHEACELMAANNRFNPITEMLADCEAKWDGVARLDRVAADYFNCEDTAVNAACMRKVLIGAVARARVPGIKFDTVIILESPEGYGKSTAWSIMAGEGNFSDENILGLKGREVQEHLQGVWIHESAELAGMSKAESEHVKAQVSRQRDKARAAYAYYAESIPRSCIWVGTTNETVYLQSPNGNRRFWPVTVTAPIDLERLARDRLQIWGEAAAAQSAGETLVMDSDLWPVIGTEQEKRRLIDPWEIKLSQLKPVQNSWQGAEVNEYCIRIRDGWETVTTSALLDYLLGKGWTRSDPWIPRKLAGTMRALKWDNFRWRDDQNSDVLIRGYRRPLRVPLKSKIVPFKGTKKDE